MNTDVEGTGAFHFTILRGVRVVGAAIIVATRGSSTVSHVEVGITRTRHFHRDGAFRHHIGAKVLPLLGINRSGFRLLDTVTRVSGLHRRYEWREAA